MKRIAPFAMLALVVAATGCGSSDAKTTSTAAPAKAAASGAVNVVMKEFTVGPTPASATAGNVTFKVSNQGKLKHEFVVLKTAKPAGKLLEGDEADETGNVGEIADLPPGSTKNLTLVLKAGHYALICNLPGHYKAGQSSDFAVN